MYIHHSEWETDINTPGAQPYSYTSLTLSSSQKMIPILTSITLENLCQSLKFIYLELCSMYCVWPHILNLMFMKFIDVTTYNSSLYIFTVTCYLILAKNTIYYIMVDGCLVCFLALALQHCSACLQYFFLFFFLFFLLKDIFIIAVPVLPRALDEMMLCPSSINVLADGFSSPTSLLRSPKPYPCLWHVFKENFYWSFKYRNVFKAYWITIDFHKINLSM